MSVAHYDYAKICKSCGVETKQETVYCFKCNRSGQLRQCEHIKVAKQCKLKTVNTKCIYHTPIELTLAQLLMHQKKVPLLQEKTHSTTKPTYKFVDDDEN